MDRRNFLRTGALGGGGIATLAGCGAAGLPDLSASAAAGSSMTDAEVRAFLAKLEDQLHNIQTKKPFAGLLTSAHSKTAPDHLARGEELARKTLRSLLLAGSFSDLPIEGRAHPAVQQRVFEGMQEMDDASCGMRDVMRALTPTERADMSRALRKDPDLAMNIIAAIDQEASAIGISHERRLGMRTLAAHVSSRLKQSSALFLDDCVEKMDKIARRDMTREAIERRVVAQMGEEEFFRVRDQMDSAARSWRVAGVNANSDVSISANIDDPPERERRGGALLTVGGILMGMAVVYTAVGVTLLILTGIPGAFVLTHGGLVLIGGITTLVLGGIRRSNS